MAVTPPAPQRRRRDAAVERIPGAFGLVLACLLGVYILASLTLYRGVGGVVITLLLSLSVTISLVSAQPHVRVMLWGGRIASVAVMISVLGATTGKNWLFGVAALIEVLLLAVSSAAVLRAVVTQTNVGFRTILGAVSVYVSLGLLFTFLYVAIDRLQGGSFFGHDVVIKQGDYLFFSMTTLTTTGYGNLVPAGQPGKIFATMEMLIGQIFLVTLIARLVSMWSPGQFLRRGALGIDGVDEEEY